MSFSLASLDWRARLGPAFAEELAGAPRLLGGFVCALVSGWRRNGQMLGITYHVEGYEASQLALQEGECSVDEDQEIKRSRD